VHLRVTLQRKDGKSKSRKTRSVRNAVCDVNVTFMWLRVGITLLYLSCRLSVCSGKEWSIFKRK